MYSIIYTFDNKAYMQSTTNVYTKILKFGASVLITTPLDHSINSITPNDTLNQTNPSQTTKATKNNKCYHPDPYHLSTT